MFGNFKECLSIYLQERRARTAGYDVFWQQTSDCGRNGQSRGTRAGTRKCQPLQGSTASGNELRDHAALCFVPRFVEVLGKQGRPCAQYNLIWWRVRLIFKPPRPPQQSDAISLEDSAFVSILCSQQQYVLRS